jgi:hypothetical protein
VVGAAIVFASQNHVWLAHAACQTCSTEFRDCGSVCCKSAHMLELQNWFTNMCLTCLQASPGLSESAAITWTCTTRSARPCAAPPLSCSAQGRCGRSRGVTAPSLIQRTVAA